MRRNLTIDILLMSLFLIFGGGLVNGQTGTLLGKPKVRTGEGNNGLSQIRCLSSNEFGQICFESPITFASLEFPCDLYVGLTFGDLETIYTSLSDKSIDYTYNIPDEWIGIVQPHYSAIVNLGCVDAQELYSILYKETLTDPYCNSDEVKPIGAVNIAIEIYCKTNNGFSSVDFCKNKDLFEHLPYDYNFNTGLEIVYNTTSGTSSDCSLGLKTGLILCCLEGLNEEDDTGLSGGNIIDVTYQESEIRIDGRQTNNTFYQIFDFNGILLDSGQLENVLSPQQTISNVYLKNGIYILVLSGDGYQSSHKFVSLR